MGFQRGQKGYQIECFEIGGAEQYIPRKAVVFAGNCSGLAVLGCL